MPSWGGLLKEVKSRANAQKKAIPQVAHDMILEYLKEIKKINNRNIIVYYSAFINKTTENGKQIRGAEINEEDMTGFMNSVYGMDPENGLDLILHTPGGGLPATLHIISYLKDKFDDEIHAIVPQIAMSGGTLISLACKDITMGRQSCLGPFDPLLRGISCHGVIEEFETASKNIVNNYGKSVLWKEIIGRHYHPTFLGECKKAWEWANSEAELLLNNMFSDIESKRERNKQIKRIVTYFGDHNKTKTHSRPINYKTAKDKGLKILDLEQDQKLQDSVLSLHHLMQILFEHSDAYKVIMNHEGACFIKNLARKPNQQIPFNKLFQGVIPNMINPPVNQRQKQTPAKQNTPSRIKKQ